MVVLEGILCTAMVYQNELWWCIKVFYGDT